MNGGAEVAEGEGKVSGAGVLLVAAVVAVEREVLVTVEDFGVEAKSAQAFFEGGAESGEGREESGEVVEEDDALSLEVLTTSSRFLFSEEAGG